MRFEVHDFQLVLFSFSDVHALFACDDKGLRTEAHTPEAVKEPFVLEQRVRDLLR